MSSSPIIRKRILLLAFLALVAGLIARTTDGAEAATIRNNPSIESHEYLVGMGDSYIAVGGNIDSRSELPAGMTTWLAGLSGGRLVLDPRDNFAVSGTGSAVELSSQLPQVLADKPGWVIIKCGDNDYRFHDLLQSENNLRAIYDGILMSGANLLIVLDGPRTPDKFNIQLANFLDQLHAWIKRYAAAHKRVVVYDPISALGNVTTGKGIPAFMAPDGIHPDAVGAYRMGREIWNRIRPTLKQGGERYVLQEPSGNLLINTAFARGGASAMAPPGIIHGELASDWGWSFSGKQGAQYRGSITAQLLPAAPAGPSRIERLTVGSLSGGGPSDRLQLQQDILFDGLTAGQAWAFRADLRVRAKAGLAGFSINLKVTDGSGDDSKSLYYSQFGEGHPWPQGDYDLTLETPRAVIGQADATGRRHLVAFIVLYFDTQTAPADVTIELRNPLLRQITSP